MANDLTFNQVSEILNSVQEQATGTKTIAATDTSSFVTVAQSLLKTGYDPVMNAISQVMARTIFSVRPYSAKFRGLMRSEQQYGNHVRKINYYDKPFEDAQEWSLVDGQTVDQYRINKPGVLQTNFYGAEVYQKEMTTFRDQLDNAFRGPDEFASFISGAMQNVTNQIEQAHENMARAALANFVGAKASMSVEGITHAVNLVTEYNELTGGTITADDVFKPENFESFTKFAYARIKNVASMMTERSAVFHTNFGDQTIMRHTPYNRMKLYMLSANLQRVQTNVLSSVFNPRQLELIDYDEVNFWQAIGTPDTVNVNASYMDVNGEVKTIAANGVKVFAVLFDEEAVGVTTMGRSVDVTPYNAAGKYWNTYWHFTERYWNDFSENGVVFTLS